MSKLILEVYLPAAGRTYDVFVPGTSKMYEVAGLISRMLEDLSESYFQAGEDAVLCDRDSGVIYNINLSVEELLLENGSRLMLI